MQAHKGAEETHCLSLSMSIETRELTSLRDGLYAAASVGVEPKETPERRDEDWPMGRCVCCGERRPIPYMQHVCEECHEMED